MTREELWQLANRGPELVTQNDKNDKDARTEFDIDVEKRVESTRFRKKVAVADIRSYTERLRAHSEFNPDFSEIVDLREVQDLGLKAADFLKLADEIDCFSGGAWRAFVVHNSVQDHAARMHRILRPKGNTKIFFSLEEARAWIGSRPAHSIDEHLTH
jgi:hypothetical protein